MLPQPSSGTFHRTSLGAKFIKFNVHQVHQVRLLRRYFINFMNLINFMNFKRSEVRRNTALHTGKSLAVSPRMLPYELSPKGVCFFSETNVSARISRIAPDGCYPLPCYGRTSRSAREFIKLKSYKVYQVTTVTALLDELDELDELDKLDELYNIIPREVRPCVLGLSSPT